LFCNNEAMKFCLTSLLTTACCMTRAQHFSTLESNLLAAVRAAHFESVIDFGVGNESRPVRAHLRQPGLRIAHPPNVNVAAIQLDASGSQT
jgi:hypothetical protein